MSNSFTKKILIEQAELYRIQQRQLRNYSPNVQAMGRLVNDIGDIITQKNLSVTERKNMISDLLIRFDKLNKVSGLLSGALPAQAILAPPPLSPDGFPKILAENGIGSDIVLENN